MEAVSEKPVLKKAESSINPKAVEYKRRIEQIISERGLTGHAKVQLTGNTLTLAGKLHPAEHGELLKFLRNAPPDVRVIDHIEYDDTPVATSSRIPGMSAVGSAPEVEPEHPETLQASAVETAQFDTGSFRGASAELTPAIEVPLRVPLH